MSDINDTTPPPPETSATPATPASPAKRRKLMWALMVSLLANAVLAGALIGQVGRGGMHMAFMSRGADRGPDRDERRVERPREGDDARQARRAVMREAFDAERPVLNKAFNDMAEARKQTAALIRAETLDAAALDASMAQMRLHSDEALASFHRAIAAAAAKLNTDQRNMLARMLDRPPQRPRAPNDKR